MTITKDKKKEIVKDISENIAKQEGVFFINFKGIKGDDSRKLRSELRKVDARVMVARKTLAKIAFEKEGVDFDPLSLEGEVGFVFSFGDAIRTAKVLQKFAKEELVSFLGGVHGEKFLTAEDAQMLAKLPSREELLAKLLGTVAAPMGGLLHVLQGNTKGLITVLAKAKN